MAKDRNDTVMIHLDRPRELKCTHKVLKRFSALTETPVDKIADALLRYDKAACLMYCMLWRDDPSLTTEQVDELLENALPGEVLAKAAEAFAAAFPAAEASDGEGTPPAAAGTGMNA